jgi:hypothetical protein
VDEEIEMTDRLRLIERRGPLFYFVAAILMFASAAKADTLKLTGTTSNIKLVVTDPDALPHGYTGLNAVIDPYQGILTTNVGTSPVLIWCVDPDHTDNIGDMWTVNISHAGGDLSQTYLGSANANVYGEMAWLVLQLQGTSSTDVYRKQELQAAIWTLAEGVSGEDGDFSVAAPGDANFTVNVTKDITDASKHTLTSGFEILTDAANQKQEYIVITPEPSALLELGVGLLALVLLARSKSASGATGLNSEAK